MKRKRTKATKRQTMTEHEAFRRGVEERLGDPLRNNPVVGWMSEAQAERILAEMREEESRGIYR